MFSAPASVLDVYDVSGRLYSYIQIGQMLMFQLKARLWRELTLVPITNLHHILTDQHHIPPCMVLLVPKVINALINEITEKPSDVAV